MAEYQRTLIYCKGTYFFDPNTIVKAYSVYSHNSDIFHYSYSIKLNYCSYYLLSTIHNNLSFFLD